MDDNVQCGFHGKFDLVGWNIHTVSWHLMLVICHSMGLCVLAMTCHRLAGIAIYGLVK